ncbi:uncharacterized protein LOC130719764 [Lotus japonicus]|uniref:uncharacterized protein LOC130719764 n=1 Tax=Lotus japonicus TaxID=34305 RepID=UPI00258CAAEE|nr:uncharacterized protein LOC130719764 [Lotus japonicus]
MKILSFNVRGLGNPAKRRVIRDLVTREQVECLCIQETKIQSIDNRLCAQLWGDAEFDWQFQPAKRVLWANLLAWKGRISVAVWCLAGDFNAVRSEEERRGISEGSLSQRREISEFNNFITEMKLFDVPLVGRKFTWVRPNGQAQSRIDRFLLSYECLNLWPNCSQLVLNWDISDHCPLLLRCVVQEWGPKPFRVLNCWFQDHRFEAFVKQSWGEAHVNGWGAFTLKEKLKILKSKLKLWNSEVFGDLKTRRNLAVIRINELDILEEEAGLSDEQNQERKNLLHEFWSVLKLHESLLCQKARSRWLKEGDQNSKYFHSVVNWRRRSNSMVGLVIDGSWEEDPRKAKDEVSNFFQKKFTADNLEGLKLNGVPFKYVTAEDNAFLIGRFEASEIKEAVWECGGDKSSGPNGFNFRFIQRFWEWRFGKWLMSFGCGVCGLEVVSKLLAIRLKKVLSKVISDNQFAVLGGRNMLDSVVILNEAVGVAKRSKKPTVSDLGVSDIDFQSTWSAFAPSKVKAFAWRMLLNRIPTKVNLRRRGVIPAEVDVFCPFCNRIEECCDHLFCTCSRSFDVWNAVYRWLGFETVLPSSSESLFSQFSFVGRNKKQRLAEVTVWMASC